MTHNPEILTVDDAGLEDLRPFLDQLVREVEVASYIESDPVAFMHAYPSKEDREIAGFFAALLAWGRRDIVMRKVEELMGRFDHSPFDAIQRYGEQDPGRFEGFVHRTWNGADIDAISKILHRIYGEHGDFEGFWRAVYLESRASGMNLMELFHRRFFGMHEEAEPRTRRHVGDAQKGSSCKRLWLYLRWCVRKDSIVDLGIMDFMPMSELMIPLDVHVARYARMLGLLGRTANDWRAVVELTERLRVLDPRDPGKYDYALFGLGVHKLPVPDRLILNPAFVP